MLALLFNATAHAAALHFLAIGDAGSGTDMQKSVAGAMAKYAQQTQSTSPLNFVLVLGDNFYPQGVTSVRDPQWKTKFETMYDAKLLPVPFIAVLGNHDWKTDSPDVEIEYSKANPKSRWQMDGHYYKRTFSIDSVQADFFLIDSALWDGDSHIDKYSDKKMAEKQLAWLREQLSTSTARWKIVAAHHPIFSNGGHGHDGNILAMRKKLLPLFNQYKVDAYITGHDHDLQRNEPRDSQTQFLISGADGKLRPQKYKDYGPFYQSTLGFLSIELTPTEMRGKFLDANGKTLNEWTRAPLSLKSQN
ncbi:MAG: acid phosphatase [Verrucomicrobiales bacterium]|nr:acid phosphatase [Verrucomicrobiales bacterium]